MNTYQIWLGTILVYSVKGDGISSFDGTSNTIFKIEIDKEGIKTEATVAWLPKEYAIIQDQ